MADLDLVIKAKNEASRILREVKGDIAGIGDSANKATKSTGGLSSLLSKGLKAGAMAAVTAVVALGVALGGLAVSGVNDFVRFEGQMNEVFTLLPGISGQAMGEMSDQAKQLAVDMGVLPDKVVPALYQAISAGVPKDNVFDFLETAQKAAVGGVTELETAVDGISSVVNAYGADVVSAAQASDQMFTAVRLGKTNFEELSKSLFNVIPTAAALGVQFGDMTAALATLTAQGTPTNVATTQLRAMLVELSKDGSEAATVFEEIAGKSFQKFIAQGGNVQEALDVMQRAAIVNRKSLQDMFGSVEAGQAAVVLAGKGAASFTTNLDAMASAAGATEAAYATMDRGLGRSFDKILAQGKVLLLDVGEKLAPTFAVFADWAVQAMPGVSAAVLGAFDAIGAVFAWLGMVFGQVQAALVPLGSLLENHRERFARIRTAVDPLIKSLLNLTTQAAPALKVLGVVIAALAGFILEVLLVAFESAFPMMVTAVTLAINQMANIFELLNRVVGGVVAFVVAIIHGDWQGAWDAASGILDAFGDFFSGTLDNWLSMAKAILLAIGSFVVGILEDMGVDVEDILDKLSDAWSRIWEGIHSVLDNIWQGKIRPVFDLLEAGMDAVGKAGWVLRNVLGSAMNSMRNAVLAPVDAIVQAFNNLKSRIDWIQGQIQALLRTFDNAKRVMGNWFPASVNSAAGTAFFAGGLTNINERGTELIALPGARQTMLPRGTTIYNAEQSRAIMAGAGGGITVNLGPITIANNMDVETMAWRVAKIIESSQR